MVTQMTDAEYIKECEKIMWHNNLGVELSPDEVSGLLICKDIGLTPEDAVKSEIGDIHENL